MKNHQKIFIGSLLLIGLTVTNLAYAGFVTEPIVPCGRTGKPPCNLCHLWHLASNVINFISFNLAIPIATLLFIAAGVIFLTSGGSEERVALAKSIFTNVVIGLIIIFCSWLLIDTLFKTIATGAFSGAWNQFPVCE
jgi:hypothetical protein